MEDWTWPESLSPIRQSVVEELAMVQGREMANQLQRCITSDVRSAEGLVRKILLGSFTNTGTDRILNESQEVKEEELISQIQVNNSSFSTGTAFAAAGADSPELISQIQANSSTITASRSATGGSNNAVDDAMKSEGSNEESYKRTKRLKNPRGSYKRRNIKDSWTKDTTDLVDDGHVWRKYGQKTIQNTRHQRNYYRCTNKFDQGCNASKHVQRIKDDPRLFRTTYYGKHKCTDYSRVSDELVLDCSSSQEYSSQNMIRFDNTNTNNDFNRKQEHHFFSSLTSIKQESVKEEEMITPTSVDDHVTHHKQSWSSWCDSLMSPGLGVFEYDRDDVISRIKAAYFDDELEFPYEF